MSLKSVQCRACGGAISMEAGHRSPRCLFCGEAALDVVAEPPVIEQPPTWLPFQIDAEAARVAFQSFARSSIWYPGDLRRARLELSPILLPAWAFVATVETHYAALVPDRSTRSNKRPVTGSESRRVKPVLIPSSSALTRHELAAIAPYNNASEAPFDANHPAAPFETSRLGREGARAQAQEALAATHERDLLQRLGAERIRVSCLFQGLDGRALLLPVYVGAYRYQGRLFRVVLNGQSGKLTGTAPISTARVIVAVLAMGALFLTLAACMGLIAAAGGGSH